jgi:predicted nucleic acid-binding Zn finger protein
MTEYVYTVVGVVCYEFCEVVSVHRTEEGANIAAEKVSKESDRYDYVEVENFRLEG